MQFPEHMVAGELEEWPRGIEHLDILHGNLDLSQVLVGPLIEDGEHDLMPMFKVRELPGICHLLGLHI